ncbi:MAG: hypothetical protein ACI4OL_06115 [Gemmiger sp.]
MDELYLFKSQDEGNRLLYAYYKGEFWFYDPNVQQWYISGHVREQYELAAQKEDGLTPDDFTCTGYGYEFVAEYEVPVTVPDALRAAKKVLPPEPVSAEVPLPRPGDVYRSPKSGQLYKIGELTNGKKTCYLTMRSNAQGGTWVPVNSSVYPKLSDAQGEFESWIRTEQLEPVVPTGDAAATTATSAAPMPSTAAGTSTTSESGEGASNSPDSPSARADMSPRDTKTESNAPATPTTAMAASGNGLLPAFDYSGLDAQTVQDLHLAEREYASGKRMAEMGLRRMADAVAIAHEALVANCDKHNNQHSDDAFRRWCSAIGITKDTAYRLLQVSNLFDHSTPREQQLLEELSPSLLYAAAKPSAPAELVQAVKDGDITTHKQYRDLLAQYNAEKSAREHAEHERDEAVTHIQAARDMQIDTARERDTALKEKAALARDCNRLGLTAEKAQAERDNALRRATEAENRAAGAQKLAEQRADTIAEQKRKICELESRPIDVAISEPTEEDKERWRKEGEERMLDTADKIVREATSVSNDLRERVSELEDQLDGVRERMDRSSRLSALAQSVTDGCSSLIGTWLEEAFDATAEEETSSMAVFDRFRVALDMALRDGEWPHSDDVDSELSRGIPHG